MIGQLRFCTRAIVPQVTALVLCYAAITGARADTDTSWVDWVVVNVCPCRIYSPAWKSDARRETLHRDFDPDVCDWWSGAALNRGDFFTARGIASSSQTEYEYQEAIGPMWGFARTLFHDNGMALREDRSWARFPPTKYGGAHMLCLNAPKWRTLVGQGMLRVAVIGDGVAQDNIGCPVSKYHPGFCDWCNRRFAACLRKRFSEDQLQAMGVGDLRRFHLRRYVAARRKAAGLPFYKPPREGTDPESLIRDPIIHEYIRFQYRAMLEVWRTYAAATKREAKRLGRPEPALYGNQAGCASETPLATMLCPHVDVVWIESSQCSQPCFEGPPVGGKRPRYNEGVFIESRGTGLKRQAWSTLQYKVGRAASHFQKPVWTMHYPEQWYGPHKRTPSEVILAEAYANGGVPIMLFAPSVVNQAGTAGLTWKVQQQIAQFVSSHRELFIDRSTVAEVGLALSLPSLLWRKFTSLRVQPVAHEECFTAAARTLEEAHTPYDVIVFGHPDFYDDRQTLARLNQYHRLVIPGADCLSDTQVEAVAEFVRQGGRLTLLGEVAARDEELRARPKPALDGLDNSQMLADDPIIKTDLPSTVWINVWRHGGGPMTCVHLVNYDIDLKADRARPVRDATLRLRSQDAGRLTEVTHLRPGAEPLHLVAERHKDGVEVRIPEIETWDIIVFGAEGELAVRGAAAQTRKWRERVKIAQRLPKGEFKTSSPNLAQTERLLATIQGRAMTPDTPDLVQPLLAAGASLRKEVEEITHHHEFILAAARRETLAAHAVRKFDFGKSGAPEGWTEVKCDTDYTTERGFGWTTMGRMSSVDHGRPDCLHRDYIRNTDPAEYLDYPERGVGNRLYKTAVPPLDPATFRVDLPNGDYVVTAIVGSHESPGVGSAAGEGRTAITCIDANGAAALLGEPIRSGYFRNRAFRVAVTRGRLELRFHGSSVGPFYHNTIDWLINGLIIQRASEEITSATQESLEQTSLAQRSTLREWTVYGPFEDAEWRSTERVFGPGARPTLGDPPETIHDRVTRREWSAEASDPLPVLHFDRLFKRSGDARAFAVTRVHAETSLDAILHVSTSQMGACHVNDKLVLTDASATGLTLSEHRVLIALNPGWNRITLEATSHWPGDWSAWAALTTLDGRPLKLPARPDEQERKSSYSNNK